MPKTRTYIVLPNPFEIEPGVYEAVYDESLRRTFRSAPQLCRRVTSGSAEVSQLRRHTLDKAAALGYRCWYCAGVMNPLTIGAPDSIEIEHQIPRSSGHTAALRLENTVAACRRCNNGAYPGKGERTVEEFRRLLRDYHGARSVVFYGEILRWVRSYASAMRLGLPLTTSGADLVLAWYGRSAGLRLHTWAEDQHDYAEALRISLPCDSRLFPLGVPAGYWASESRSEAPLAISA